MDVAQDALAVMGRRRRGQSLEALVLDFSDALYVLPLLHQERRFFVAKALLRGAWTYVVFLQTPQGSRNAPQVWGRLAVAIATLE